MNTHTKNTHCVPNTWGSDSKKMFQEIGREREGKRKEEREGRRKEESWGKLFPTFLVREKEEIEREKNKKTGEREKGRRMKRNILPSPPLTAFHFIRGNSRSIAW